MLRLWKGMMIEVTEEAVVWSPLLPPQHSDPFQYIHYLQNHSSLSLTTPPSPPLQHSEPDQYIHYLQNQISPRSRADYDAFNRAHFGRLDRERKSGGGATAKRAVTPKVRCHTLFCVCMCVCACVPRVSESP
jgi:hypothetical protein